MSSARQGGWRLEIHSVLPSTSDLCRVRAQAGAAEGLAVLARRQTDGRGTQGRGWASGAGNLCLSVLLRPAEPARRAAEWSLLAGVALVEALAVPAGLALKWPNDVLLHGRKLAGILVESAAEPDGTLAWLIIGIGVNLAVAPEVSGRATACLAEVAPAPAPEMFAVALLDRLALWRERRAQAGFAPVREAWLRHGPQADCRMALRLGSGTRDGGFAGLAEDGRLLLRVDGRVEAFAAGEIVA